MLKLKAKSNLRLNPAFAMAAKDIKAGFLGVYLNSARLNPVLFTKLWARGMADEWFQDPTFAKTPVSRRDASKALTGMGIAQYLRIKKEQDHFVVWFPVASLPTMDSANAAFDMFIPKKKNAKAAPSPSGLAEDEGSDDFVPGLEDLNPPTNPEGAPDSSGRSVTFNYGITTGLQALSGISLPSEVKAALSKSLLEISVQEHGIGGAFVTFKMIISKAEAQYMANSAWIQIRPIDLYSILQTWVATGYGGSTKTRPARTAMPISEIAKSIPSDPQAVTFKTSKDGLSVTDRGELQYIPRELNNTQRYEDLFIQAGTKDDSGVFRLRDLNSDEQVNLPANVPVLVDWLNSKFSYTNTSGALTVRDLTRNQEATSTHINSFLNKDIQLGHISNVMSLASAGQVQLEMTFQDSDWVLIDSSGDITNLDDYVQTSLMSRSRNFADFFKTIEQLAIRGGIVTSLQYGHLATNSPIGPLRAVGRLFKGILRSLEERMETAYRKYGLQFITANMGYLILVAKFADQWDEVNAADRTSRSAAINQGVSPDWRPEALPLINEGIGRLPHQTKVANIMRDSPQFAIFPVQAGGGKSMLIITDILQELKRSQGSPYLLICPSHLISNYVDELVFFTKGRLNVISVATYTIYRQGLERLTSLIQNAPRNTVIITSFDNLTLQAQQICYGTSVTTVFPIVEMLRRVGFGYVAIDESHYVKNETSRSKATMSLIADIPKKRLASGTMSHDSPSDIAIQIGMMDPTLFGSRDDFNERFGEVVKGNRVIQWKAGAQREISDLIKSRVVVAGASRKEWAALLPPKVERFVRVRLTDEQMRVYRLILSEAMEEIQTNAELMRRINDQVKEEEDNPEAEASSEELEALLKPYLQRLERFVNAPAQDELGTIELRGSDRISPKAIMTNEIIRNHIEDDIPGKVMVFTNYTITAEEIYATLDPEIQARSMVYRAAHKTEDLAKFAEDDRLVAMIGVEQSLNTGLNLQILSRLIRVETVWNPGTLEQGNSRLERPQLKSDEERARIYYDWIVADNTIDITKVSRLISKTLAVAKFENVDNQEYETLPDLPIIHMNLANIQDMSSWDSVLQEYDQAYSKYRSIMADEYAQYRADFVRKYGSNFMTEIEEATPAPDMELIPDAPFVRGMALAGADQLGLVRLDIYISGLDSRIDLDDNDEESDTPEVEDESTTILKNKILGMRVFTEFGEGSIIRVLFNSRRVVTKLDAGNQVPGVWSSVFVHPDNPDLIDIKSKIAKFQGLKFGQPTETKPQVIRKHRVTKKEIREQEREQRRQADELSAKLQAEIYLSITNGFLSLVYYSEENDVMDKALEALGFRPTIQFYYAHLPTAKALYDQVALWSKRGFLPDPELENEMQAIYELHVLLKEQKLRSGMSTFKFANRNQLRNFYRMEHKPNSNAKIIRPYPIIEDGEAYLALPIRGQVGTKAAIRVRAPRIKWELSSPSLAYYALQPGRVVSMIKKINSAGITILNEKDLNRQVAKSRRMKVRDSGALEL